MSKCSEDLLNSENINYENNQLAVTSSFCIKEASNLFIALTFNKLNNENNYNEYVQYLNKLNNFHNLAFWKGNILSDWNLYFKRNEIKNNEFIGLKNLGSTCYINTILQIFFNIKLLKESLLQCETPFSKGKNCLYQLKKVFYALSFLKNNYYYTPTSFIENFDNEKLDPKIQMDVFEFLGTRNEPDDTWSTERHKCGGSSMKAWGPSEQVDGKSQSET